MKSENKYASDVEYTELLNEQSNITCEEKQGKLL